MKYLGAIFDLTSVLRREMNKGLGLRSALNEYFKKNTQPFSNEVRLWLSLHDQGKNREGRWDQQSHMYVKALFVILEKGLRGHPIHAVLTQFEEELKNSYESAILEKINRLPFEMLVPLLVFMLPAYLLLLVGPLIEDLLSTLGSM